MQEHLLGDVWVRIQRIVMWLFIVSAPIILLDLVVGVMIWTGLWFAPIWVEIEMRIATCICSFIMCFRILDDYVCQRCEARSLEKYTSSAICGIIAFIVALAPQDWGFAVPLLVCGFVILLVAEVPRHLQEWRKVSLVRRKASLARHQRVKRASEASIDLQAKTLFRYNSINTSNGSKKLGKKDLLFYPSQRVFISYSHKDKKWLQMVHTMLQPLVHEGMLDLWDDTRIQPGADWLNEIELAIRSSGVVILLISANFLSSNFIRSYELPKVLAAAQAKGTVILPLHITASLYNHCGLDRFQAMNPPSRPLEAMTGPERNRILLELANIICQRCAL